jgi:chorismate mutase
MSNKRIKELLARLHAEVKKTEVDAETRSTLRELDSDIHELLESSEAEPTVASVLKRAKRLEAEFAVDHPTIERFMREVIDMLAKIGV